MRQDELNLLKKCSKFIYPFILLLILSSCNSTSKRTLPILGNRDLTENGDTIYHQIPEFSFVNQFGDTINQKKFENLY